MLTPAAALRILVCTAATDMRKNFDGLAAIVEWIGEDPLGGSLYFFRNRRGDRLKLLYRDGDGYALWYKRLERGTFQLPAATGDSAVISSSDLAMLLDGVDLTTTEISSSHCVWRANRRRVRFFRKWACAFAVAR